MPRFNRRPLFPLTDRGAPRMRMFGINGMAAALAAAMACMAVMPANAGLSVSPVIVDFLPGQPPRADVELVNSRTEQLYVAVEPSEIAAAGTGAERRVQTPDPQELGLLASPGRLILEPGQHKFVRIAMLQEAGESDRIYRITIKPV